MSGGAVLDSSRYVTSHSWGSALDPVNRRCMFADPMIGLAEIKSLCFCCGIDNADSKKKKKKSLCSSLQWVTIRKVINVCKHV